MLEVFGDLSERTGHIPLMLPLNKLNVVPPVTLDSMLLEDSGCDSASKSSVLVNVQQMNE